MDSVKAIIQSLLACCENVRKPQQKFLVTLFSTAKKNKEIFEDFFIKTFAKTIGSALVPLAPPLLGLTANQWDLTENTEDFLGKVEPLLPGAHLGAGNHPTGPQ